MRKTVKLTPFLAAGLALFLTGCGADTGKILGLEKKAPDEFTVFKRAPLSLPPDYGLRPPDPDAKRDQDVAPRDEAKNILIGKKSVTEAELRSKSAGDVALLSKAGALDANPKIRRVVDNENAVLAVESEGFVNDLLFWQTKAPQGTIIDATAESQRIQENEGLGRDVTEGDTPMIRREAEQPLFKWPF